MDIKEWAFTESPNYDINVDKIYPYSEVPHIGQFKLVKIPVGRDLIELVDYWGEGRLHSNEGISGFPDCYNVNLSTQCVSNGPDRGKKIPNRVPVLSYDNCDTSKYIKDDSVKTVTLMGAPINNSCAKDIGRMVNSKKGKVIVFGFDDSTEYRTNLETELSHKNLIRCDGYDLPENLRGLSLFESIRDPHAVKTTLRNHVVYGHYDLAVSLSKGMLFGSYAYIIREVITELLNVSNTNIMTFAYRLWNGDAQRAVIKYFPTPFKLLFNEDNVKIFNKKNNLALKLAVDFGWWSLERMAWGDAYDKTSQRVDWKFLPVLIGDEVAFKIMNVDCGMFLNLATYSDRYNDREAWGSFPCDELRHCWYLHPVVLDGELLFFIINSEYNKGLKLDKTADWYGDRQLWSHHSDVHSDPGYYGWYIEA